MKDLLVSGVQGFRVQGSRLRLFGLPLLFLQAVCPVPVLEATAFAQLCLRQKIVL